MSDTSNIKPIITPDAVRAAAAVKPQPSQALNQAIFNQALKQYPVLQGLGLSYKSSPGAGGDNMLEFWQPGDEGGKDQPRPQELPLNKPGVEVYSDKTRPIDILGDAVSHYMVNNDPKIKNYYQQFQESLTPEQKQNLQSQYEWSKQNDGEKRPYDEWAKTTGIPAYFRGYAFDQWPKASANKYYTSSQIKQFDEMMKYLSTPQLDKTK